MRFIGLVCILLLVGSSFQVEYEVKYALSSNEVQISTLPGQTPIVPTTMELQSGGYLFQLINIGLAAPPSFTLNGNPYYVLGALFCNDTLKPIYNATSQGWYCGDFAGYPANSGLISNVSCAVGQVVYFSTNGSWICHNDSNIAAQITGCVNGSTIKYNGASWVCAPDVNTLATVGCAIGQMLQWVSGSPTGHWSCYTPTDTNLLGQLNSSNCGSGQVLKLLTSGSNGVWGCDNDHDTLGNLACAAGQIFKYSVYNGSGTWGCGYDSDVIKSLNCTAGYTVVSYGANNFSCVPAPTNNVSPPQVFIDGQSLSTSPVDVTNAPTFFGSFIDRETAPFTFSNGFSLLGYSFVLSGDPRLAGDPSFNFTMVLKVPGAGGAVLSSLTLPAGTQQAYTTTFVNFQPGSTGLSCVYSYSGLNNDQSLTVTSTILLGVNQPKSS